MLKNANKLFLNQEYQKALVIYEKLLEKDSYYANIIGYNMKVCKSKLPSEIIPSYKDNKIDQLLGQELINSIEDKKLPKYDDIKVLLESIKIGNITKNLMSSIIKVTISSPFQIKLLTYTRSLLVRKQMKELLYRIPVGLNIATMIKLATDKEYWLKNRTILKKKYKELYEAENLFQDLLDGNQYNYKISKKKKHFLNKTKKINNICQEKTIGIGTILLNEEKFIGLSLFQHYNFCDKWVLVEGTCLGYPTRKVTESGFSKDLTQAIIEIFPDPENKIKYIRYGWTSDGGENAKNELRNEYLKLITEDYLIVLDADEFYIKEDLQAAFSIFNDKNIHTVTLPQVHFWKSTKQYITGEYYDVSHIRIYRNYIGMRYIRNHNWPELYGEYIHEKGRYKFQRTQIKDKNGYRYKEPCCYHMGFAKDYDDMKDKSDYYINRGEATTRKATTESRAAWFNGELPENCRVKKWIGKLPKVLKE